MQCLYSFTTNIKTTPIKNCTFNLHARAQLVQPRALQIKRLEMLQFALIY